MRIVRKPGARVVAALAVALLTVAGSLAIGVREVERAARADAIESAEAALRSALREGTGPPVAADSAPGEPRWRWISADQVANAFGGEVALWRRALESGLIESRFDRRDGAIAAAASRRATDADGPRLGILEARVPAAVVAAARREYVRRVAPRLLLLSLVAGALVWWYARGQARPYERLESSAAALARGELRIPLRDPGTGTASSLAASLATVQRRLREADAELGRRRSEQDAVLSGIAEGVYAVDRDRRVRYVSPRAAAMLGVTQEEAIGRFCGDLLRPLPVDGVVPCESSCPILQARFRGPVRALERIRPAGGAEFAAVLSSSPEAGGLQVQILHEESPDEAARRSRDAVVADLAHELKTPLAAQRASLELLRERLVNGARAHDPAAAELAAGVEAGALRLERLIDNLLESVRIESGELAIRRVPVDLEVVVEEATATTAALFAKRGQTLTVELPFPLPRLTGDPPRLTQALVNLLANAAKYAPEGSEAVVGGTVGARDVALWVENEGPGLSPADLPRLSARYRRGLDEASRAEAPEAGSGLGLWIARSIAERHGGELGAERLERDGRSRTRVILRLPAAESAA